MEGRITAAQSAAAQKRRVIPKRLAAIKAVGSYTISNDITGETAETAEAVLTDRTLDEYAGKRKRGPKSRANAAIVLDVEDVAQDGSDHEAEKTPRKRQKPTTSASTLVNEVVQGTRLTSKINFLDVKVADNDDNDGDFSPSARKSGKNREMDIEKETGNASNPRSMRKRQAAGQINYAESEEILAEVVPPSEQPVKRKTVRMIGPFTNTYKVKFGYSPFRYNTRPSAKSCHMVYNILKKYYARDNIQLERYPQDASGTPNQAVQGPMHASESITVHNIVKTILSQATNNENALTVEQSMIDHFRFDFLGEKVKGTCPNYHLMRKTPLSDVSRSLAIGGLHNTKAKQILACLETIHECNIKSASKEDLLKAEHMESGEMADFMPSMLSLEYMNPMTAQEKFDHLVSLPGVGPKTAACILCFNFDLPVFAVDTHVARLSKMLRWIPRNTTNLIHIFIHLDKRVPDDLKYGLHQAFWHHGQACIRCKAGTDKNTKGWNETTCPIEHLVDRTIKDPVKAPRGRKLKQEKKRPTVYPHAKLTPEQAAELGYELRTITVNDDFGVRRANITGKVLLKWVLMSDREAVEHSGRKATAEDIKEEVVEEVEEEGEGSGAEEGDEDGEVAVGGEVSEWEEE
jgi:endonuclease III